VNAACGFLYHLLVDSPHRWHPLLGVFYLTYRCDFRCPYCSDGAGKPYYVLPSPVLSASKVTELLTNIRRHCQYLVVTGGEPLQHPEFSEVMAGIPALRFRTVILTTNGYALDTVLDVVAPAVHELVVSLDTLVHEKADGWYGVGDGALQRVLNNLDRAARHPKRRFEITLSSVVTPDSIADLPEVYRYARQRGYKFAACPQLVGVKAHPALADSPDYRRFYDLLVAEKKAGGAIHGTVDYLEHMRDLRKFRCHPFTMLVVSPVGDVFYPCLELGHFAGNLLEEDSLHRIRQNGLAKFGPRPDCDNRCHSACALGFSRLLEHPVSLLHEVFLLGRTRLRRFPGAPRAGSSASNPEG
jgi:MoaA/NifB/PqqE/SkfB family radical SAM enzyme